MMTAGSSRPIKTAIMASETSSSMSVNPARRVGSTGAGINPPGGAEASPASQSYPRPGPHAMLLTQLWSRLAVVQLRQAGEALEHGRRHLSLADAPPPVARRHPWHIHPRLGTQVQHVLERRH